MTGAQSSSWLSPDDAAIYALENTAILGHTVKVAVLEPQDRALDLDALAEHVGERVAAVPRALQRIETDGAGRARWVDDDAFEIGAHVGRDDLVDIGTGPEAALWAAASSLMERRLDHGRPLWRLDVVGPFVDGREAIVARIHHAMADGISCLAFLDAVLWTPVVDTPAAPGVGAAVVGAGAMVRRHRLARMPGALVRELGGRSGAAPFDRHIGTARSLAFPTLPLADLRRIGHARPERATVNDVLLAVVAGALRRWSGLGGTAVPLRAQVPVCLHARNSDAGDLGNHDSFINVDLPLDEANPIVCLDRIRRETALRKQLGDADALSTFFHALARYRRLESAARQFAFRPHDASVAISNVPGPAAPVEVLGRRVERIASAAEPADRHALRISAISYAGSMTVGLCLDPAVLPDVAELAQCVERSFHELRRAG